MTKEPKVYVKQNLKWLMSDKISPTALAEITKVPQPTIFRILQGDSADPRTSTIRPLAEYFGVSVSDLRDRDLTQGERPQVQHQVALKVGGGSADPLNEAAETLEELQLLLTYRSANAKGRAAIDGFLKSLRMVPRLGDQSADKG